MLFFLPSIANVLLSPTSAILAALQPKQPNNNPYQQLSHTSTFLVSSFNSTFSNAQDI
jgi:hypothetical protein